MLTIAVCVVFNVSLNFANVIVLPLLLGIGIDTAIHLVHRATRVAKTDDGPDISLLRSSAATAAFYSGLTTLVSFGTMAFARHQGLASLGAMLWIGVFAVLLVNLILIPAILSVRQTDPCQTDPR